MRDKGKMRSIEHSKNRARENGLPSLEPSRSLWVEGSGTVIQVSFTRAFATTAAEVGHPLEPVKDSTIYVRVVRRDAGGCHFPRNFVCGANGRERATQKKRRTSSRGLANDQGSRRGVSAAAGTRRGDKVKRSETLAAGLSESARYSRAASVKRGKK